MNLYTIIFPENARGFAFGRKSKPRQRTGLVFLGIQELSGSYP